MRGLFIFLLGIGANSLWAQTSWVYDVTDISHNIMIPGDAENANFAIGDLIGVFYKSGEEMICAGYSEWTGDNIALTAFGASFTFNGLVSGQEMFLYHWDSQAQTEAQLYPVFNTIDFINGDTFLINGLSAISYFNTAYIPGCTDANYVEFDENALQDDGSCSVVWSDAYQLIISSIDSLEHTLTDLNLENDSLQLQTAFLSIELESEEQYSDSLSTEVAQSIDEIETLENTLTDLNLENNSLYEDLDSLQAAITLLLLNDSLHQESNSINEVEIPLFLPQGWGMFGYTCIDSMSVNEAFIPIIDRVILIKDYNGEFLFPEYNFNGIGNLIYSRGYQSYLSEEVFDFSICPTLLAE